MSALVTSIAPSGAAERRAAGVAAASITAAFDPRGREGSLDAGAVRAGGSTVLRLALSVLLLSTTVLQSMGINFGSYSLNAALLGVYGCLAVAALSGVLALSLRRLVLYVACVTVALASLLVNANFAGQNRSSLSSYLLLVAMYLPFIFTLDPGVHLLPRQRRRRPGVFAGAGAVRGGESLPQDVLQVERELVQPLHGCRHL